MSVMSIRDVDVHNSVGGKRKMVDLINLRSL